MGPRMLSVLHTCRRVIHEREEEAKHILVLLWKRRLRAIT